MGLAGRVFLGAVAVLLAGYYCVFRTGLRAHRADDISEAPFDPRATTALLPLCVSGEMLHKLGLSFVEFDARASRLKGLGQQAHVPRFVIL